MSNIQKRIPVPRGFLCSGIAAGIKEKVGRKDLGLIVAEANAVLGGVYTQNKFPSAHVQYCREHTPTNDFRALIVNSGNANAATGTKGLEDNQKMVGMVATRLGVNPNQVFSSSTGIIGRPFPLQTVENALDELIASLEPDASAIAEAIMTTDTKQKVAAVEVELEGQRYSVLGFAKGSGMIHPNMATMLSYILTDAPLPTTAIQALVGEIAGKSFNCVSVDGDTSTNDSFYLISSNPVDEMDPTSLSKVKDAILEAAVSLAKQIASDGEGAEHLIQVTISDALDEEQAHTVANGILTSCLVKTAINGCDPNWGRILMAVGKSLTEVPDHLPISIWMQSVPVYLEGEPVPFDAPALSALMKAFDVSIVVKLGTGSARMTGWGSDFSEEYVKINADYST